MWIWLKDHKIAQRLKGHVLYTTQFVLEILLCLWYWFLKQQTWFCTIIKFCIKCVDVYGKPFMTDKCIFVKTAHHRNIFWHIEVCKSNKHLHFTFVILDGIWLHRKRRLFNYFDPFFHHMSSYASFAYTVCQRRKNSSCTCIFDKKIIWSKQVWQEGAG